MVRTLIADFDPVAGFTFRDAKPFQAGENSVARGLTFPPNPGSFWAAARRALHPRTNRTFEIVARGFAVMEDAASGTASSYWPAPLDIYLEDAEAAPILRPEKPNPCYVILAPRSQAQGAAVLDAWSAAPLWAVTRLPTKSLAGRFLNSTQWRKYLQGQPGPAGKDNTARRADSFCHHDLRTGVQMEERHAVPGQLYTEQIAYLVREPRVFFRLIVEAENPQLQAGALVRLGGEARMAHISFSDLSIGWHPFGADLCEQIAEQVPWDETDACWRVKLCLLTPAVFSAGTDELRVHEHTAAWEPNWFPRGAKWWKPFPDLGYEIQFVSAITGKQFPLGLWDTEYNDHPRKAAHRAEGIGSPRPLYRCVPAGAVYYLRLRATSSGSDSANKAKITFFDQFWFRTVLVRKARGETYFGKMGFGVAVIGGWDYAECRA